jgi:hypothetical protein
VTPSTRLVGLGAAWSLAVAFPATLVAQIADAAHTGDGHSPLLAPCALVVLVGMGVGGAVVGVRGAAARQPSASLRRLGALAALVAVVVVLALGLVRTLVAGQSVSWVSVPALLVLSAALGAMGAALGDARARTSRP